MAGAVDKHIFQRGLAHAHCLNLTGEGFHKSGDEAMSVLHLDADLVRSAMSLEHGSVDAEAGTNALCEGFSVGVRRDLNP